jgi:hypothetical protein
LIKVRLILQRNTIWYDDSVPTFDYHMFCFSLKDNIALIAVLEAKFGNQGTENPGKRQLLCVVCQSFLSFDVHKVAFSLVRYDTMLCVMAFFYGKSLHLVPQLLPRFNL